MHHLMIMVSSVASGCRRNAVGGYPDPETLSLSKSVSIFHASLGENASLAREAGDAAGEAYWSGLVAEVDAMIYETVRAGFGSFGGSSGAGIKHPGATGIRP